MRKKPIVSILYAIGLAVCFILCIFATGIAFVIFYSILLAIKGQQISHEEIDQLLLSQNSLMLIISYFIAVSGLFYIFHIQETKMTRYILFKKPNIKTLPVLAVNAVGLQFVGLLFLLLLDWVIPVSESLEILNDFVNDGNPILVFIAVGITAPIAEELVFRGVIFKKMANHLSWKIALVIQAVLFSLVHMNVAQFPYAFVLGLFTGYSYHKTNNIWNAILIHFFFNSVRLTTKELPENLQIYTVVLTGTCFIISVALMIKNRISKLQNSANTKEYTESIE